MLIRGLALLFFAGATFCKAAPVQLGHHTIKETGTVRMNLGGFMIGTVGVGASCYITQSKNFWSYGYFYAPVSKCGWILNSKLNKLSTGANPGKCGPNGNEHTGPDSRRDLIREGYAREINDWEPGIVSDGGKGDRATQIHIKSGETAAVAPNYSGGEFSASSAIAHLTATSHIVGWRYISPNNRVVCINYIDGTGRSRWGFIERSKIREQPREQSGRRVELPHRLSPPKSN